MEMGDFWRIALGGSNGFIIPPEGNKAFDQDIGAFEGGAVGVHETCTGVFKLVGIGQGMRALFCPNCGFRRTFPTSITTYKQLNKQFRQEDQEAHDLKESLQRLTFQNTPIGGGAKHFPGADPRRRRDGGGVVGGGGEDDIR